MRKLLTIIDQANPIHLFWLTVATSIVLAARMQAIQHGWINPDSVLYLEAAKLIANGDFRGAYNIFGWPFYAFCIGLVSKVTGFDTHLSAQFLNMVFFGIATASYLKIIQLAGGKNLTLFAGALLLFGNLYIVGDVLEMLMRDQGFWAFYLASLVFFIRFYQQNKVLDALLWQVTAILAVLFRIEAITFLLLLPLIFVFDIQESYKQRTIKLLKTYSISLFILAIIFIAIYTVPSLNINSFGRLQEVFNTNLWDVFSSNLISRSSIMSTQVLGEYLEEYAIAGLLMTFVYVILVKNITTLGAVGVIAAGLHFKNKFSQMNNHVKRVLTAVSIICVMNMALIITKVFVLSSRYIVAITFILLIVSALYLGHLFNKAKDKKQTRSLTIVSIAIIVLCLSIIKNVLPKQSGYNYMQDAVAWVKNNQHDATVFYEDARLRYYARAPFIGSGVFDWKAKNKASDTRHYDYLVINFGKEDQKKRDFLLQSLPEYQEIKRFYATKNKKYSAIYQIKSTH
ncbi:MAG: hypothetical protein P8Q17_07465 [Methylophilaceae bacterium]|nr:hypothetical protein [Methylophilaceae bacterium]